MEYHNEILCFTGAAIINLAPIPQKAPFYDATGGPFTHSKVSKYLELYAEEGVVGVCPCTGIMENTILPLILTGEKMAFAEWMHKVYWACRNAGFDGETAGEVGRLEYILIDILAKRVGMPFHRFLGAAKDSVTVYGSGGSTHLSGKALADEMEHFVNCGYKTVKIKIGTDFGTRLDYDVERVKLVRETIGPDIALAIDGNHVFTPEAARRFADRVESYQIAWFEEPIHAYDFTGYRELSETLPMLLAAGESVRNHYLFEPYLAAGIRHFQPVPSAFAGVREWMMVRDLAVGQNLKFSSGGLPLLACPLIATADDYAMEEFLEVCNQPVLDCMEVTMEQKNGRFYLPDIPGLPFKLNVEWLRKKGFLLSYHYISCKNTSFRVQ